MGSSLEDGPAGPGIAEAWKGDPGRETDIGDERRGSPEASPVPQVVVGKEGENKGSRMSDKRW